MDYWATAEATQKLLSHLGCGFDEAMQQLHIDIPLGVHGQYVGPKPPEGENIFGLKHKAIDYGTGTYNEVVHAPLAEYESVEEIEKHYTWPSPDWWDYS
jgi:uroporphyrinogen decarboxylase